MIQGVVMFAVRPAVATFDLARRSEREMRRQTGDALGRATLAIIDGALADGIADRIAERLLSGPELERIIAKALEQPGVERIVNQVVASPVIQDAIARVADDAIARLRDSPALWALIDEIAQSPSVAEAITAQGYGFADQVGDDIRERSRHADARLERLAWRLLRRRSPPGGAAPSTSGAT
ncbi:MAG TPA: hypothetical protein VFX51_23560 [Solirubrobacteraceae bacterium]|nr:hypothetical protein [Solirubrobacteraceae bacterium]